MRKRANFVSGIVDDASGLTAAATSMTSTDLARLPAVTAPDIAALVLTDPTTDTFEIVHVTAHTASSTTATIARGKEGTTAKTWAKNAAWAHALTVQDIAELEARDPQVLDDIGDVDLSVAPLDQQTLYFDAATGTWKAGTIDTGPKFHGAWQPIPTEEVARYDFTDLDVTPGPSATGDSAVVGTTAVIADANPAWGGTAPTSPKAVWLGANTVSGTFSWNLDLALLDTPVTQVSVKHRFVGYVSGGGTPYDSMNIGTAPAGSTTYTTKFSQDSVQGTQWKTTTFDTLPTDKVRVLGYHSVYSGTTDGLWFTDFVMSGPVSPYKAGDTVAYNGKTYEALVDGTQEEPGTGTEWAEQVIEAAEVRFTPAGDLAATDVQAALAELDAEKAGTGHTHAPASGTTANRPASPTLWQFYGDDDLGKPIWWDGTAWIDATGTAV